MGFDTVVAVRIGPVHFHAIHHSRQAILALLFFMLIVCVNSVFSFADVCLLFLVRFNNVRTVISYWLRRVSLKFGCGPLWTWVGRGSLLIPMRRGTFEGDIF